MQDKLKIAVIGGGLAGSEASFQLLRFGCSVDLYEMRPEQMTPAHVTANLAELLCSNSLRSMRLENAGGVLKKELQAYNSLLMEAAIQNRVPAGFALAVDREGFSQYIETKLKSFANFRLIRQEIRELSQDLRSEYSAIFIATGPLTSSALSDSIREIIGEDNLYFYDAKAPIVESDSLDPNYYFRASRYSSEEGDYLNCPFNEEEYKSFYEALVNAETTKLHHFEDLKLFSGCQPIEEIARQGYDALRYGPMKPVGIELPGGGEAYAILQLRQDNAAGTQYNLTGCQTRLTIGEQERVFRLIPALERAVFVTHGQMHRNSYINSPQALEYPYRLKSSLADENLIYIIGQLSGVEGYLESAASGLLAAIDFLEQKSQLDVKFPPRGKREEARTHTILGGLATHCLIANKDFQPAKSNFGLLSQVSAQEKGRLRTSYKIKDKGRKGRRLLYALRSLEYFYSEAEIKRMLKNSAK